VFDVNTNYLIMIWECHVQSYEVYSNMVKAYFWGCDISNEPEVDQAEVEALRDTIRKSTKERADALVSKDKAILRRLRGFVLLCRPERRSDNLAHSLYSLPKVIGQSQAPGAAEAGTVSSASAVSGAVAPASDKTSETLSARCLTSKSIL
jgi:hypothetical protein